MTSLFLLPPRGCVELVWGHCTPSSGARFPGVRNPALPRRGTRVPGAEGSRLSHGCQNHSPGVGCCCWHPAPATPAGSLALPAWHRSIPAPPFPGSGTPGLLPPACPTARSRQPPKNHTDAGALPPAHLLPPARAAPVTPGPLPPSSPLPMAVSEGAVTRRRAGAIPGGGSRQRGDAGASPTWPV